MALLFLLDIRAPVILGECLFQLRQYIIGNMNVLQHLSQALLMAMQGLEQASPDRLLSVKRTLELANHAYRVRSCNSITSVLTRPRANASRLPSADQSKLKICKASKCVICRGGPPSTGWLQRLSTLP